MQKIRHVLKIVFKDKRIQAFCIVFVFLWAAFFTQMLMKKRMGESVQISEAFMGTKVVTPTSSIDIAGKCASTKIALEEKKLFLHQIADKIGLDLEETDFVEKNNKDATELYVERKSKDAFTKMQFVSVDVSDEEEEPIINNYVMIHLEIYDQIDAVMNYKRLIQDIFQKLEITQESSYVQYTGSYPGNLALSNKNKIANKMMRSLKGRVMYENRTDDFYTVYAYSGSLRDYISVGGSKINIQIAMNYNEVTDKTMVYLATPIMNGSY